MKTLRGLQYLLMKSGDIFLVDFKPTTIIEPEYSVMNDYDLDQLSLWLECVYDREKTSDSTSETGTFQKRMKIKDIEKIIEFGKLQ